MLDFGHLQLSSATAKSNKSKKEEQKEADIDDDDDDGRLHTISFFKGTVSDEIRKFFKSL